MLPQRNSTLAWKKIGPYFVIVDPVRSKQIFSLNEMGQIIWNYCDGKHSIEECIQEIISIYDVDKSEAKKDIQEFIDTLLGQGVLIECS